MKTPEYPKVAHEDVRCPLCRRSLASEREHHHPFNDAPWAKHCGAPCYGTAWYTHKPAIDRTVYWPQGVNWASKPPARQTTE